jgi:lipopolysaccharide/colanic/teichoic acid biosynthesis glycosyltransferase
VAVAAVLGTVLRRGLRRWRAGRRARGCDEVAVAVIVPGDGGATDRLPGPPWPGCTVVARLGAARPVDELRAELVRIARDRVLTAVVLATDELGPGDRGQLLTAVELGAVELWAVPALPGLAALPVRLDPRGTGVTAVVPVFRPVLGWRAAVKRAADVVGATLALVLCAPVMAVAAVAVKRSSPGPVLFRQLRAGVGGRGICVLKFRTMVHGAPTAVHEAFVAAELHPAGPGDGSVTGMNGYHKLTGDPRVTPVGRVLRRFSIDELPQLLNVLKGDMSLVGPRPALPYETRHYEPWQWRRLDVRPGMTGLWQVSGRARLSMPEMVRLDVEYVDRCSLGLDLRILARTPAAVLRPGTT